MRRNWWIDYKSLWIHRSDHYNQGIINKTSHVVALRNSSKATIQRKESFPHPIPLHKSISPDRFHANKIVNITGCYQYLICKFVIRRILILKSMWASRLRVIFATCKSFLISRYCIKSECVSVFFCLDHGNSVRRLRTHRGRIVW